MNATRRRVLLPLVLCVAGPTLPAAVIKEFPLAAGAHPALITVGADGNLWFAETGLDKIGRITPGGAFQDFSTLTSGCAPVGVTLGPDGQVWYTCTGVAKVGAMPVAPSPQSPPHEYPIGVTPYGPIAPGPAGFLSFTDTVGEIALFNIDSHTIPSYVFAVDSIFVGVANGGDGRLWATDATGSVWEVRRNDSSTTATGQARPTPSAYPYLIAWCQGWGGAWLAEGTANKLAYVPRTVAGTGDIIEVALPTASSAPYDVACGAEGSVWYTAPGINKIARYRRDTLTFEEFPLPTASANVNGLAIAGDGSVWFTEFNTNKIGRLQLRPQGDVNGDGKVDVADVFYLINFLFAGGTAPVP
jgi:virginiamycin B lyase